MKRALFKAAIAVVLLVLVLCIFLAPSIDLEPCALRTFQFIALFAFLLVFPIHVQVGLIRSSDELAIEWRGFLPMLPPLPALEASCVQLPLIGRSSIPPTRSCIRSLCFSPEDLSDVGNFSFFFT
jgi:hypothetical protein